jgi:hypothetical protein
MPDARFCGGCGHAFRTFFAAVDSAPTADPWMPQDTFRAILLAILLILTAVGVGYYRHEAAREKARQDICDRLNTSGGNAADQDACVGRLEKQGI